jgi:predicted ATP-grasp superfamily ATP-dependent carboligase
MSARSLKNAHALPPAAVLSKRSGAIVVGAEAWGSNALGVVRSLGRHGIPVWVLASKWSVASTSRYTKRTLVWPETSEDRLVEYLLGLAEHHRLSGSTLPATSDKVAAFFARQHPALSERFQLTTPPWEVFRWAYDKRLTYQLACSLGIQHPWIHYPSDKGDLLSARCRFPVILKPAFREKANDFTAVKAWRIDNREELLARYEQACAITDPSVIMLQALIPGGGECQFSYAALCEQGRVLASAVARRTRQYPADFGNSSTYVETIVLPEVEELGQRFLGAIGYSGIAEIEFKRDPRDGGYNLLDFNARSWFRPHCAGAQALISLICSGARSTALRCPAASSKRGEVGVSRYRYSGRRAGDQERRVLARSVCKVTRSCA